MPESVTLTIYARSTRVNPVAGSWRRGDVVNVSALRGGPAVNPTFVHLHVTGTPSLERVKSAMEGQHFDGVPLSADPAIHDQRGEFFARRGCALDFSLMPIAARNALVQDRELTITFLQLKAMCRRRLYRSVDLGLVTDDGDFS
jgi:hypothetical protein